MNSGRTAATTKCVLIWSKTLKHFLTLRRTAEICLYMHIRLNAKYAMFLSDFNQTCIFSTYFPQNYRIKIKS